MSADRLVIVDPSYATRTGHNHAVNSLLLEEAGKRGIGALLFANQALGSPANAVPGFRATAYDFVPASNIDALRLGYQIAQSVFEDLERFVGPVLQPQDILLVHTANNPILHGLASWFAASDAARNCRLRVGLNLPPDFRQPDTSIAEFNSHHYSFIFSLLESVGRNVKYYAETSQLAELFRGSGARPIEHRVLPLRVIGNATGSRQAAGSSNVVLFCPGELRTEKGHEFLIAGAIGLSRSNPEWLGKVRFRFTRIAMPDEIRQYLETFPQLFEIVPDLDIPVERYWELIHDADFVVCAYDPKDYKYRASGPFLESLAAGTPVFVSSGTSMADEIAGETSQAGVFVEFGNAQSLSDALQYACSHRAQLSIAAQRVSARYVAALSASKYLDWVIGD